MTRNEDPKIIHLHDTHEFEKRETEKALAAIRAELARTAPEFPVVEIDILFSAALGDTGQSRTCRYLFCLLVGVDDPTGFKGDGLLEIRTLDRKLADAFLKVVDWWRGPTTSDKPIYDIVRRLEEEFSPKAQK